MTKTSHVTIAVRPDTALQTAGVRRKKAQARVQLNAQAKAQVKAQARDRKTKEREEERIGV